MRHISPLTNPAHAASRIQLCRETAETPSRAKDDDQNPRERPDVSHFDKLPDTALIAIRALATILGKGVSTVWRNIHSDPAFPKPIRLGEGCTRFKVGDIRAYLTEKTTSSTKPKRTQRLKGEVTP